MAIARLTFIAPVLIATCLGPCVEVEPQLGISNRFGTSVDVFLDGALFAEQLPTNETTDFEWISLGRPDETIRVRTEDVELELELSSLIGNAEEAVCYLVIVEPCETDPDQVCARVEDAIPDRPTDNCEDVL